MKKIIATITLVAAMTLGVFGVANTASAQEASGGFLPSTNAGWEQVFSGLAEAEGWLESEILDAIAYCQTQRQRSMPA